jgi:GBP family porin
LRVACLQRKRRVFDTCHMFLQWSLVQYVQLPENGGWLLRKSRAPVQTLENLEMKKTLVALAALAATSAFAQSSVTISGTVDVGYSKTSTDNTTAAAYGTTGATDKVVNTTYGVNPGTSGALTSNRLIIAGTEDLGAGRKAGFHYELGLNYASGASGLGGTSRQSFISLADAKAGTVSLGRQYTPIFAAGAAYDAGGANNMAAGRTVYGKHTTVYAASTALTAPDSFTRADSSVMYTSPTVSGVTVKLLAGKNATTTDDVYGTAAATGVAASRTDSGMSVNYANGPLSATFAQHTYANKDVASGAIGAQRTNARLIGASYDLGVAKLMAMNVSNKTEQSAAQQYSYNGTQYGVTAPFGAVSVFATYGKGESDTTKGVRGYDHKAYQLGASYALSKRTNAYVAMGNEVATLVSSNKDVTIKQTIAGLRHSF